MARVMSFSATRRVSIALALVVTIRSCLKRTVAILRSRALRCAATLFSLLYPILCFIGLFLLHAEFQIVPKRCIVRHAEAEAPFRELGLDLQKGFLAEVPGLGDFFLGFTGQVAYGLNIGVLEAIGGTHRKFKLLHRGIQDLAHPFLDLVALFVAAGFILVEIDKDRKVILGYLGRLAQGVFGLGGAVGPDLQDKLVVIRALAYPGGFDRVLDLGYRREDSVHGDGADYLDIAFVNLGGHVAPAEIDLDFQIEVNVLVKGRDMDLGIEYVQGFFRGEISSVDFRRPLDLVEEGRLLLVVGQAQPELLKVVEKLDGVLDHSRNGFELAGDDVLRAFLVVADDPDGGDRVTLDGRKKNAPQGIPHSGSVSRLEWVGDELAVGGSRLALLVGNALRPLETFEKVLSCHFGSLFRIKLDDELFADICHIGDVLAMRVRREATGHLIGVDLDPRHGPGLADFLQSVLYKVELLGLLDHRHLVARLYEEGRNGHPLAVHGDMAVIDQLARLGAGGGEMHSVDHVVQPALQENKKVLAGFSRHGQGFFESVPELGLHEAVGPFEGLLFPELGGVFRALAHSGLGSLSGGEALLVHGALVAVAAIALQKKLFLLGAAKPAHWSDITCHFYLPPIRCGGPCEACNRCGEWVSHR
ncbi:membrane hypothetical protein [uncultured Spirochaetota bacterium]|uniref:Uncharacterized protein n=1 Tax=uncultured Spirochaetota bacterium TaxID=460511 RepID=A0A652ZS70_9SPIR|nr:membrane hypothetical protein [uncultured Spirochaetota bacterium]